MTGRKSVDADAKEALARLNAFRAKANPMTKLLEQRKANEVEFPIKYGPDFEQVTRSYTVNKAERTVIDEWLKSLVPEIMKLQGRSNPFGENEPYYGAIGGGISYNFTPTGLGDILVVKESTTGKELNVTEALDWFFFG